jgi:hypothetical protein
MNTIPAHAALPGKNISSPYMCMHRRSAAWCLTAHEMSHSAQYCALVNERSYGCFERAVCPSNQAADFSLEAFRPSQRVFGPLVIFIGQNPQPTPSGWKAVRQVRSSAESPNAQEHSGLRVLRWTAGDQQHWVLLDYSQECAILSSLPMRYKSYHPSMRTVSQFVGISMLHVKSDQSIDPAQVCYTDLPLRKAFSF